MARPTKYDEAKAKRLHVLFFEGLTIKDACYGVGISDDTFRRWRDKYPDFNKRLSRPPIVNGKVRKQSQNIIRVIVAISVQKSLSAQIMAKRHILYRLRRKSLSQGL